MAPRTTTKAPKAPIAVATNGKVKDDFVTDVGGVEVRLPAMGYLKPGLVRQIRRLGPIDALYTLIELSATPEALAALDDMDPEEYEELLSAWRDHSGVSLGE